MVETCVQQMRRRTLTNCWMIRRIWRSTACPQAVASLWQPGPADPQSGTIGMPYFDWEPIQNHRAQYALIDVEEDGVTNLQFRKVAYDYEAELQDAKDKGLPFIEMYEELRREDNYRGHNIDLLTGLIGEIRLCQRSSSLFQSFQ